MSNMELTDNVQILFKNKKGLSASITITARQLLDCTTDDFYDMLEQMVTCTSSSCNNESQNFCDCPPFFEDYEIVGITTTTTKEML